MTGNILAGFLAQAAARPEAPALFLGGGVLVLRLAGLERAGGLRATAKRGCI